MLVTFSGLDGAGKSTLIAGLAATLRARGRRVRIMTMYDDLTSFSLLRGLRDAAKRAVRFVFRQPEPPPALVEVDDRGNVRRASSKEAALVYRMTRYVWLRQLFYPLDVLVTVCRLIPPRLKGDVVILDRYFYDSMVDIAAARADQWFYDADEAQRIRPSRLRYMRWILSIVPTPTLSVFVDVPAETAFSRKPEYPLAYLAGRRVVYRRLFDESVRHPLILDNMERQRASSQLLQAVDAAEGANAR
jgi:thymidylate kinase